MQIYTEDLKKHGIKPSYTRLMIYSYLKEKMTHPTVDEIYTELADNMPTLSKTTVYNTLHLFTEKSVAKAISVNNQETRYDLITHDHAHFKCNVCGQIYDIEATAPEIKHRELSGFEVDDAHLLYTGKCPKCKNAA